MELVTKAILLALIAGLASAVLQKSATAFPLVLGIAVSALILLLSVQLFSPIRAFLNHAGQLFQTSRIYVKPMLKCLAIGVLERLGVALCRDSGQAAAGEAISLLSAAAAFYAALPLLEELLALLERLL